MQGCGNIKNERAIEFFWGHFISRLVPFLPSRLILHWLFKCRFWSVAVYSLKNGILAAALKTYSMINKLTHQTSSSTVYLLSSWLITVACCVDNWDANLQNTLQITEAMTVSFTDDIRQIFYDNKHVNLPVK